MAASRLGQGTTGIPTGAPVETGTVGAVAAGVAGGAWVATGVTAGREEVLGVSASTAEEYAQIYQQMSWGDKIAAEAEINDKIRELEQQLAKLPAEDPRRAEINRQISDLKAQQKVLDQVINKGIKLDGPTRNFSSAGCVKFVAEKRNITKFIVGGDMGAKRFDDHARAKGFEVGKRPVKGSIMVIEPKNSVFTKIDKVNGHVAIVDKVTPVKGGYKVTYSDAGTPKGKNGKWTGEYKYVNQKSRTTIIPYNATGVSFIYDKKKK